MISLRAVQHVVTRVRRRVPHVGYVRAADLIFKWALILSALFCGVLIYQRTINMWAMKNMGDAFLSKADGSRRIILGAWLREKSEQNVGGKWAVIHFLGDGRIPHSFNCITHRGGGDYLTSSAQIERIHRGKRTANDICSWGGHIAECEVDEITQEKMMISMSSQYIDAMTIDIEQPLQMERQALVVCVAPMYIYTDWEIMLTGIETWLALGATKIVVPVQSASATAWTILKEYEKKGIVLIRPWTKWPILSDVNPNGLVLSRGIEESHVNCLFFVKPWADLAVFTDIDDMLLPIDASTVRPGINIEFLRSLFEEHPQAGSLLFEHRDVQFRLPKQNDANAPTLASFSFDFLQNSKAKMNCQVWRMKTRVVVNASRVDSVNMHETGIHRFGYVQTRVPCRKGHFYHLRHSHGIVGSPAEIDMTPLNTILNSNWRARLSDVFPAISDLPLNKSSTESFEDFDRCMGAINEEHWTMSVSRCLTPHVCYSRLKRDVDCVAARGDYEFFRSVNSYFLVPRNVSYVPSESNCEAPTPRFSHGNHFFLP